MMRIAIPQWQGRVSPVFDVAANLLIREMVEGREVGRQEIALIASDAIERARQVAQTHDVDVLICGAISSQLEAALSSAGVLVIAHICGRIEEVLEAFQVGELNRKAFMMPGYCSRRRRVRSGHRRARNAAREHGDML